jgi:hypothetical protein
LLLNHTKFHENENQLHENAQIGDEMFAGALDCYEQKERKKENPVA